jgi:hypothetical protein
MIAFERRGRRGQYTAKTCHCEIAGMPRFARQPRLCSTEAARKVTMKMDGRNGGLAHHDHDLVRN